MQFRGDMVHMERATGKIALPASRSRFLDPYFWNRPSASLFLPYFKIHGSLNWVYNESILVRVDIENWIWNREDLPLYWKLRDLDWPQSPLLKPYVWEPGNKQWFTNAYQQVAYTFFEEALKHVEYFVFVGYSFRDRHLLDALTKGLRENPAAKIIAIDPIRALNPDLQDALRNHKMTHIRASLSNASDELRTSLSTN
jgi:hypothetical protein